MPVIYGPPQKKRRGNSLITRGLGKNHSIITQGYVSVVREIAVKIIRLGQSGSKRAQQLAEELKEIAIWAKLVKINDEPIEENIQGLTRKNIQEGTGVTIKAANLLSSKIIDTIKFTVKRLK